MTPKELREARAANERAFQARQITRDQWADRRDELERIERESDQRPFCGRETAAQRRSGSWASTTWGCDRRATKKVDGMPMCGQHAGAYLAEHPDAEVVVLPRVPESKQDEKPDVVQRLHQDGDAFRAELTAHPLDEEGFRRRIRERLGFPPED